MVRVQVGFPARRSIACLALLIIAIGGCDTGNGDSDEPNVASESTGAPTGSASVTSGSSPDSSPESDGSPTVASTPATAIDAPAPTPDSGSTTFGEPTNGPLAASTENGRYFADRDGRAVFVAGAHTWTNLQDGGSSLDSIRRFDFEEYLDFLSANGHNFFRLWAWEQAFGHPRILDVAIEPLPFARSGPGVAEDGRPKFDLETFDDEYFARLRERVEAARDRGIYVSVMLFNGFSIDDKGDGPGNACPGHPFNAANNVNGIDVDVNGDGRCEEAHTLMNPDVTAVQERYVAHVIDTVGDLDNVLYEVSNESHSNSQDWQYRMIDFVRSYEAGRAMQHPVGMTVEYPDGDDDELMRSSADWISPNDEADFKENPPPAPGEKVVLVDTDHLWGVGGDERWVWKTVTRGYNVLYMDCYDYLTEGCVGSPDDADRVRAIANMGYARTVLDELDLATTTPVPEASSSGFALHDSTTSTYVIYVPEGDELEVTIVPGEFEVEWLDPGDGRRVAGDPIAGGGAVTLQAPFENQSVLLLRGNDTS